MTTNHVIEARAIVLDAIANESKLLLNDPHPPGNLLLRLSALVSVHSALCREMDARFNDQTRRRIMDAVLELGIRCNDVGRAQEIPAKDCLSNVLNIVENFVVDFNAD